MHHHPRDHRHGGTSEATAAYVPVEAIGITAIIISIFAVYLPHTVPGAPAYIRISLLVVAINNIMKGLNHWLSVPDAGLESNMRLFLGPPSSLRTMTVGLRRKEGQELFWYGFIMLYVAYYAPDHAFIMLNMHCLKLILFEMTNSLYGCFMFDGMSMFEGTPEEYGFTVDMSMVAIPLFYSYAGYFFSETV